MSSGKCGLRTYANITQEKMDIILNALRNNGSTIQGSNPWSVNTNQFGVVLQGVLDESSEILSITVTAKNFLVPCAQIWNNIDPLLKDIANS